METKDYSDMGAFFEAVLKELGNIYNVNKKA